MPTSVVKTREDEIDWNKAKQLATESGNHENYPYIMGIFKRISKTRKEREHLQQTCFLDSMLVLRWKDTLDPVPISVIRRAGVIPSRNHIRLLS